MTKPLSTPTPWTAADRGQFTADYIKHYRNLAKTDIKALAPKIPSSAFTEFFAAIDKQIIAEARRLIAGDSQLKQFLECNSPPTCLNNALPEEFRAYALLLHALNQWIVAKKLLIDCALVGGSPKSTRDRLRAAAGKLCMVTDRSLDGLKVELHHPVRDGRPPIPLSAEGHKKVDGLLVLDPDDAHGRKIVGLRSNKKLCSWTSLRTGAALQAGRSVNLDDRKNPQRFKTYSMNRAARAMRATSKRAEELLAWLDRYELGLPEIELVT